MALMCIAGALLVRGLLDPALSDALQFLTLFGGIALAVWFCGWLAATVAAGVRFAAEHWLILPRENVAGSPEGLGASFAGYVFSAGAIICIGEAMRRAPLRAMQGFAQLLSDEGGALNDTGKDHVQRIMRAAERMDRLIGDVRAYSRVVTSGPTLMPIDVGWLLREKVEHHTELRAPHARVTIDGGHTHVLGSEAALLQCFTNLLANAAKFVAPGATPEIHISATTNAGRVRVAVRDNGIGIAPAARERIFRLFERLNRNYEGTGVGLAIVKKSAERFGGSVGVMSAPGQGSTFWVELAAPPAEGRG